MEFIELHKNINLGIILKYIITKNFTLHIEIRYIKKRAMLKKKLNVFKGNILNKLNIYLK